MRMKSAAASAPRGQQGCEWAGGGWPGPAPDTGTGSRPPGVEPLLLLFEFQGSPTAEVPLFNEGLVVKNLHFGQGPLQDGQSLAFPPD